MRRLTNLLVRTWLITILSGIFWASLRQNELESHHLERSLLPGFDAFGRSCASLTLSAAYESIRMMIPAGLLCLALSFFLSAFTLIRSSRAQFLLRTLLDLISSLPGFLIALALGVLLPGSNLTLYLGVFLLIVPSVTRFFESQLLKLREEDFILASESLGAGLWHLWKRHYLPELIRILPAILPFLAFRLILLETSLTYLGLGSTPRHETWGRLLFQGKDYLIEAPWILWTAATPLCLLLFSFHLLSREDPL